MTRETSMTFIVKLLNEIAIDYQSGTKVTEKEKTLLYLLKMSTEAMVDECLSKEEQLERYNKTITAMQKIVEDQKTETSTNSKRSKKEKLKWHARTPTI